jgi:hypothetical protein
MREHMPSPERREPVSFEEMEYRTADVERRMGKISGNGKTPEQIVEEENQILSEFAEELIREKERFFRIFRTERGSIYFQIEGGECVRIASVHQKDGKTKRELQPMVEDLYLLEETPAKAILATKGLLALLKDLPMKTAEYAPGAFPFEVNVVKDEKEKIMVDEEDDTITLIGTWRGRQIDTEKILGKWHVGHPISEIIK